MQRTRVKICGITRLADARLAVQLGADALGFVFVPASQRFIEPAAALTIVAELSPFVTTVGLFLDTDRETVKSVLTQMPGLVPQFHGRESAVWCDAFGRPYVKAMGVADGLPSRAEFDAYRRAQGFLLDSQVPGQLGGTGHAFDWRALGMDLGKPLILAGGLNADNVAAAVRDVTPYALDVSSGVEAAKGIKDADALRAFMAAVALADSIRIDGSGDDRQSTRQNG